MSSTKMTKKQLLKVIRGLESDIRKAEDIANNHLVLIYAIAKTNGGKVRAEERYFIVDSNNRIKTTSEDTPNGKVAVIEAIEIKTDKVLGE